MPAAQNPANDEISRPPPTAHRWIQDRSPRSSRRALHVRCCPNLPLRVGRASAELTHCFGFVEHPSKLKHGGNGGIVRNSTNG